MQYYESPVYGEWCKRIYGKDLKQMGMVTMEELELFYREVDLAPESHILDIGCGPGYISAAVAEHFGSCVTGIDIDEGVISHARKTFSDDPKLNFQHSDGNEISFEAASLDLICFFDTLYFTGSVGNLHTLLDKCLVLLKPGGKLAVFWSNHPTTWFGMQEPTASTTHVGIWGRDNKVSVKAVNLTETYRRFWLKAMKEIFAMMSELRNEIPESYETLLDECSRFSTLCAKGDAGGMFRWLYVFTKDWQKKIAKGRPT
jgi:ubiquinone/menaquinone biosynthesis C-methylase UbiE